MSEINKENCLKLATYLETKVEGKKKFNMNVLNEGGDDYSKKSKEICGTVACAIGYAPMLFKPVPEDYSVFSGVFKYTHLCERVFNIIWGETVWDWCFNTCWAAVDNTAIGAAARIRYMVEHGVPEGFCADDFDWVEDKTGLQKYVNLYTKGENV